jgi:hypothetical protein
MPPLTLEAHQTELPADTDRTGAILAPKIVGHRSDMLEPQLGAAIRQFRKLDANPTYLAAEFPGKSQVARRLTSSDLAACIAF